MFERGEAARREAERLRIIGRVQGFETFIKALEAQGTHLSWTDVTQDYEIGSDRITVLRIIDQNYRFWSSDGKGNTTLEALHISGTPRVATLQEYIDHPEYRRIQPQTSTTSRPLADNIPVLSDYREAKRRRARTNHEKWVEQTDQRMVEALNFATGCIGGATLQKAAERAAHKLITSVAGDARVADMLTGRTTVGELVGNAARAQGKRVVASFYPGIHRRGGTLTVPFGASERQRKVARWGNGK